MPKRKPFGMDEKAVEELYAHEGFKVVDTKYCGWHYETDAMKRCPNCGAFPIIEPSVLDQSDPPVKFIAVCDYCGLRTKGEHSPETCVKLWNANVFTEASMMICRRAEDVNIGAGKEMVRSAVKLAITDIYRDIREMWEGLEEMAECDKADDHYWQADSRFKKAMVNVDNCQNFIETVCGTIASRFLAQIRKTIYPEAKEYQIKQMPTKLSRSPEWAEMQTLLELRKSEGRKNYTMAEIKSRTQRPYTQYVNHMVRFFLSREESLELDESTTGVDAVNWTAVQGVFRDLPDEHKKAIRFIFAKDTDIVEQVRHWAELNALELDDVWTMLYRFSKKIAKVRGLI